MKHMEHNLTKHQNNIQEYLYCYIGKQVNISHSSTLPEDGSLSCTGFCIVGCSTFGGEIFSSGSGCKAGSATGETALGSHFSLAPSK